MDESTSAPTPGRTEDGKQPIVDSTTTTVAAASGTPSSSGHDDRSEPVRQGGIILVPQPSSDPRDPLNWTTKRKATVLASLLLAMFVGLAAPFCGQLNLIQQAQLYHKETISITYFNSAASAGLATGGYLWWPLAYKFGRSSVIFWCLVGVLATQIWAPLMTHQDQYVPYLISRFFAAFFGIVVALLGPPYLVDMFYLHQRGRAFTLLHFAINFGVSAGPTFSGFVAAESYWPVEYWWSVGLTAFSLIPIFLFLEETSFDRSEGAINRTKPDSWVKDRVETFFPGNKVMPARTWRDTLRAAAIPFKIAVAPVVILIAAFNAIGFGFYVALNALTPLWLQLPIKAGGIYQFTVAQNAAFSFIHWIGLFIGLIYGHFFSDRIPLWLAARNKGRWKPEYRLHTLWPTSFVMMPVGLGLVGIAMQYRLHWAVMAVAQLLVTVACLLMVPVSVNYICECFRTHPSEATLVINSVRLLLGLSINFYMDAWIARVGVGWVYGMMAFFSVFAFLCLVLLMIWGHQIRAMTPFGLAESEEGAAILTKSPEASDS